MNSQIALRWLTSVPVSCLHAAAAFLRKQSLADPLLCDAVGPPAERLQAALLEESVPPERFWSHVIPLAAEIISLRELAHISLIKTVGRSEAAQRTNRVGHLLTELNHACAEALPRLDKEWKTTVGPLRQRWDYHGTGILGRMVQWTEPGILLDSATAVLVYPALRGGGAAHLPYNLVHVECQHTDPVPDLPEVVRLAWLLSQLNLDLPRYSETVSPCRLATVASLAMLPIALTAAAEAELVRCNPEAIRLALRSWLPSACEDNLQLDTLVQWWETYRAVRPGWATALRALSRLLDETETGST